MKVVITVIVLIVVLTCQSTIGKAMGANQAVGTLANRAIQSMKKVNWNSINNQAQNSQLFYEKIKKGYVWFKRLREETLKKQQNLKTGKSTNDSLKAIKEEILNCSPVDSQKTCFSPCQKLGYDYLWCYDSSERRPSQWSICSCDVKKPILEYLDLTKRQLLEPIVKPFTNLELALLVTATIMGAIVLFTGIAGAMIYWKNRNVLPVYGNQQGFIANPIYAGAGNQE